MASGRLGQAPWRRQLDGRTANQGIDTFSIKTDTYEAAGNVQHGNVQLHKQELVP